MMNSGLLLRNAIFATALASIVGAASPAAAVDGVIEINDARARQGGVTPGDMPGYPVTLNQPGSYRLTGDLFVTGTNLDVVVIDASHVVLDLNGFSIRCLFALTPCKENGSGVGVRIGDGVANVVVRNGAIRDVAGRAVVGGRQVTLEDLRVVDNGGGLILNGVVRRSIISGNGSEGVFGNADISDCLIQLNGASGIQMRSGSVRDSRILANEGAGVVVESSMDAVSIVGNVIEGNESFGIVAPAPSAYRSNILHQNGDEEVQVSGTVVNRGENVCGSDIACP